MVTVHIRPVRFRHRADVPQTRKKNAHFTTWNRIPTVDIPMGIHYWLRLALLQCVPVGLYPIRFRSGGTDHTGIRSSLVRCHPGTGTVADKEHTLATVGHNSPKQGLM